MFKFYVVMFSHYRKFCLLDLADEMRRESYLNTFSAITMGIYIRTLFKITEMVQKVLFLGSLMTTK